MDRNWIELSGAGELLNNGTTQKRETGEPYYLNKYSSELRSLFLMRLLQGNIKDLNTIQSQMQLLNLPYEGYRHVICVISVTDDAAPVRTDMSLCFIEEQISRFASKNGMFTTCCRDQKNRLVIAISSQADHAAALKIDHSLPQIIEKSASEITIEVSFGISPEIDQIVLVAESYDYAIAVLESGLLAAKENSAYGTKIKYGLNDNIQTQLLQLFRESDMDAIAVTIHNHVESIKLNQTGRQILVERFAVLYLQNITNECMRLGITLERFESYIPAVVSLMQLDAMGSIKSILQLTEQILKYISIHKTNEGNHLLNMAKEFILQNMGNERLDLATVSDYVGLSRVYFCKMFHQLEGVTFSVYLKNLRIEKAKQLLLTTNMKVFEVSDAVGFSHSKYFCHVFKEVVGQTPVEFQKGIRKDI